MAQIATERRQLEEKLWASPTGDIIGWREAQARVDALGDDDTADGGQRCTKEPGCRVTPRWPKRSG